MALDPQQQQFEDYMINVLGIGQADMRDALRAQGLGAVLDFSALSESDIEDVCRILRRPGGMIPNPNAGRGRGIPDDIPNPGVQIGHLHEKKLKMVRYVSLTKNTTCFRSNNSDDGYASSDIPS
jgi:hypothetical protein